MSDPVLGDYASIIDCAHKTAPRAECDVYGYSIGTRDIKGGRLVLESAKPVSRETFDSWTQRALPVPGDLVLGREAPVGEVGMVKPGPAVCLGQRTVLIQCKGGLDSAYLLYLLRGPELQQWMRDHSEGSTVKHINVADVRKMPLRDLPPVSEQHAIAKVLGAFDELIDTNRRLARDAWLLAENLYLKYVEGKETTAAGETMALKYGKSLPKKTWVPGRVLVASSAGIVGRHNISLSNGPGVVVGRVGTAGSVTWVPDDFYAVENAFYVTSDLPLVWCYFQLKFAELPSLSSASAVPAINREAALAQQVPVSHPEDIRTLCASLDELVQAADELNREIGELERARDVLLPALISGKITSNSAAKLLEDVTK